MTTLRDAVAGDLPAITEIYNALLATTTYEWREEPHTIEEMAAWLAARRAAGEPVIVAVREDGTVVGWASYDDFRDATERPGYRFVVEHSIHVAESHWGQGIGSALLDALVDAARVAGKRVLVAAIDGTNTPSIAFHARLGFDEVARMPAIGEKWGQQLDLVLMQRRIDPEQ